MILISCTSSKSTELKSNKTISETFNKSEIKDLQIIFDFFNGQICDSKKLNTNSLNECYEKYCSEIREQQKTEYEFNPKVNFEQQLEIYKQIDKSTFNEIWYFQKSLPIRERKDTLKYISLNTRGKYIKFLEKYGEENKAIFEYFDSLKNAEDMSPVMFADLIMSYEKYETKDIRTKLFISIHYLTLNDQFYRKEKY